MKTIAPNKNYLAISVLFLCSFCISANAQPTDVHINSAPAIAFFKSRITKDVPVVGTGVGYKLNKRFGLVFSRSNYIGVHHLKPDHYVAAGISLQMFDFNKERK